MGAGLLGRSLVELARVDMGFESERLAVLRTTVPVAGPDEFPRATAVYRDLLSEVRSLPGVAAAGAVTGAAVGAAVQRRLLDRRRAGT